MKQRGLTLVELMISMVLGLLLTAGVISLFTQSQRSYSGTRDIAIMDQNAQVIIDLIERDVQRVGYSHGCRPDGGADIGNAIAIKDASTTAAPSLSLEGGQLLGFSTISGGPESLAVKKLTATTAAPGTTSTSLIESIAPDSDYFMMMVAEPDIKGFVATRSSASPATYQVEFSSAVGRDLAGQPVYFASPDCTQVSQFMQGATTAVTDVTAELSIQSSGTTGLENCTTNIVGDFTCATLSTAATSSSSPFALGSNVLLLEYIGYAIKNATDPKDRELIRITATGSNHYQSLLKGVSKFNLLYGIKGSATEGVYSISNYLTATQIEASTTIDWSDVMAVKVTFELSNQNGLVTQTYSRLITLRNRVIN